MSTTMSDAAREHDGTESSGGGQLPPAFDLENDKSDDGSPVTHDYGDDGGEDGFEADGLPDPGEAPAPPRQQGGDGKATAQQGAKPAARQQQQKPAESNVEFSDELIEEASLYGFDPKDYRSPADLERDIRRFDKQVLAWGGHKPAAPPPQQQQQQQHQPPATGQRPINAPQAPAGATQPHKFEKQLPTREMMDPELYDYLTEREQFYAQRDAEREQRVAAIENHYRQTQQDAATQTVVGFFEGLGEEYADLFGKGPVHMLKSESPELANVNRVLEAADAFAAGFEAQGKRIPSDPVLLKKALLATFPERIEQSARNKLVNQLRNRRGQFTARPTQRQGRPLTGEDRQVANIRAKMAELGMNPNDADDDDVDDGLPG